MRIRLGRLGAPMVSVRTDGETEVVIDPHLSAPRAETMLIARFPDEDPAALHKLINDAYLPPFEEFPPPPRVAT